jgi:hypothetical protein
MPRTLSIILFSLIFALPLPSHAQETVTDKMLACKKIENDGKRLTCFDAIFPHQQSTATKALTKTQKQYTDDDIGAEDLKQHTKSPAKEKTKTLKSGLIEFGTNRSGKYFFVLTNGQIWTQIQSETNKLYVPKKLNDVTVVITRTSLGGHSLRIDGKKRSIKVKRLR